MRVDSENLIARASASDIQDMCKKVRDAFKYSDPMSHEGLTTIEAEIKEHFALFTKAIVENNILVSHIFDVVM